MNKEIYFDNAATTRPYEEVIEVVNESLREYYNPSSIYNRAIAVSKKIENVRALLKRSVSAEKGSFIFTSGGTESINSVIQSMMQKGKRIVTSAYEHDATMKAVENTERNHQEIIRILPANGKIQLQDIVDAVDEKTALVSLMHVNNEVGHITDIAALGKMIKKKNPRTLFHVDAIQSYMKYPIDVEAAQIDFLSISAHKIHGIKGVGALYVRHVEKFKPLIFGGGQEGGNRSGTENVPGILALGKAVEIGLANFEENAKKREELRSYFLEKIAVVPKISINSADDGASHIVNISFLGVPAEILLHSLEAKNIFVSGGSACSAKKKSSRVLEALRLSDEQRNSAIRFSFSTYNNKEEIDIAVREIESAVSDIRKITKYKG